MNLRTGLLSCCFLLASILLPAQQSSVFTEANLAYKRGADFFNQGIYGLAQKEFYSAMTMLRPVNEPEWRELKANAELYHAKCAVRLGQPEAEKLVLDFLRDYAPSPVAGQAALEIGDYYFGAKMYDKALLYYEMAPGSGALRDELRFKQGYSLFVTKKFSAAKSIFASIKENARSEWYYPANYYYGCCAFFEGRYDDALKAFQRCENSDKYKQTIPYYITQIYFAKKQYDQVISYGEPRSKNPDQKNRAEINQLVGQAYFEKGDFKRAQPYLEYAANNGVNFRPGDFYQLGYTQYQNGFYKQAIQNFEQLSKQDSLLGQNGLYHLGDCYIRTRNKFAARNAFGQAANMNYDRSVKEDALFNYAKLSYELKYDRDAIEALQRILPASKYYDDAQALMSEVFLNTRDYDRAISTLEGVKNRNQRLDEAYQQVCYLRGVQLYQNNMRDEARRYFNKSLEEPIDKRTVALCSYWMGVIAHENGEYESSKNSMSAFLNQAKQYPDLPEESGQIMGHYVQGYNFLKLKDYGNALANFRSCVDAVKRSRVSSEQIKNGILGDAILRAGDCHFKRNQYNDALTFYNEAVNRKYDGFEYALYQKATIKGLQGNKTDQILALDDLINRYPKSEFTDEALLQLGETYQSLDKLNEAIVPLRRIVSEFRGKSNLINQALLKLGLISYNQGNNQAAINYYKQVFANNPENQEAKDALAALEEIYVREMNRPDEYFAFLETVPGYNVTNAAKDSVTYNAAEVQYQRGNYQQAIDGFTSYLAKYPNGRQAIPAYYMRAESYASGKINKQDMALRDFATVVSKGPSKYYPKAAEKGALIAFSLKNYSEAFELARKWEESATSVSSRTEAQLLTVRSAYQVNNSVAVTEYANKVINTGGASNAQIGAANFYVGKIAYDKGDFGKAYTALENVTKTTDGEEMAEAYHLLAQMRYKQRQYADAEELVTNANKASAGYDDWIARNLILLSDVYADQGDKNSAMAALEVIIENYKGDQNIMTLARQKYAKLGGTPPPPVQNSTNQTQKGIRTLDVLDLEGGN